MGCKQARAKKPKELLMPYGVMLKEARCGEDTINTQLKGPGVLAQEIRNAPRP